MDNLARPSLPPNASPEEVEAWQKMMDTMVTFIRASTHLMNTINNKVERQIQARVSQPITSARSAAESDTVCIPECLTYFPVQKCGVCGKPQLKRPTRTSSIPVTISSKKPSIHPAASEPIAAAAESFHSATGDLGDKPDQSQTETSEVDKAASKIDSIKEEPAEGAQTEEEEKPLDEGGEEPREDTPLEDVKKEVEESRKSEAKEPKKSMGDKIDVEEKSKKCSCPKTKEMQQRLKARKSSKCVCNGRLSLRTSEKLYPEKALMIEQSSGFPMDEVCASLSKPPKPPEVPCGGGCSCGRPQPEG